MMTRGIPASAAAFVALLGFGLIYWALLGLGLLQRDGVVAD